MGPYPRRLRQKKHNHKPRNPPPTHNGRPQLRFNAISFYLCRRTQSKHNTAALQTQKVKRASGTLKRAHFRC